MNSKKVFLLIIILFVSVISFSQLNTEKMRKHTSDDGEGFVYNANFNYAYATGNMNYTAIDGTGRIDYNYQKFSVFVVGNYNFKKTPDNTIINKSFFHLRNIYNLSEKNSLELFYQNEFNEKTLLDDRNLIGASFRTKLFDIESKKDSLVGFISNCGIGGMLEKEVYGVPEDENPVRRHIRLTTYLTIDWTITRKVNFWMVSYFQPNVQDFSDFRTIVESGLDIHIIGYFWFTTGVAFKYNNEPVSTIKYSDLLMRNGLRFTFP